MAAKIASGLSIKFVDDTEITFIEITQIYIIGNFLSISAIPLTPDRGNVLVTKQFPLSQLDNVLINFK